ncbi:ZIP family metal transporter [Paenisporosarcina cavernae]|uniref:ZIP family metal transporter n=1 Tax=Paenisporosarcina cavernae TaxID=2320858 RepID=A0A385YRD0_9BACL|nr:ZIP family metal transporter [Paenisporosarcina cavernae]AYC28557.1 ZIP family metal transporter [Paenisporosarcina cavernae]
MWQAVLWGGVSGSAVLIGALVALFTHIPKRGIGIIMSFGTGVLMGAATFELLGESAEKSGLTPIIIGFLSGALIFTLFDFWLQKRGAQHRKRSHAHAAAGSGLAIFLGTVMDAIPESIMIGASLTTGGSVSWLLVIAIFLSNFPEGLSSTTGLQSSGFSKGKIIWMWIAVLAVAALSSFGGYFFLEGVSESTLALIASFAGGGIMAMVASTMMPEAYEEGGPVVGFVAAAGLLVSLVLTTF